jgi:hypothetical protein
MMAGEDHGRLQLGHQASQNRDTHRAYPAGSLPTKRLVHEKDVRVRMARHRLDVVAIEVAATVARERFRLAIPRRRVVARQSDDTDRCPRHERVISRPEVSSGEAGMCASGNGGADRGRRPASQRTSRAKQVPMLMVTVHPNERDGQGVHDFRVAILVGFAPGFPGGEVADLQDGRCVGNLSQGGDDRFIEPMDIADRQHIDGVGTGPRTHPDGNVLARATCWRHVGETV